MCVKIEVPERKVLDPIKKIGDSSCTTPILIDLISASEKKTEIANISTIAKTTSRTKLGLKAGKGEKTKRGTNKMLNVFHRLCFLG